MQIKFRNFNGETFSLDVYEDDTILNSKARFQDKYEKYHRKNLQFIYKGQVLKDFKTFREYGVEENKYITVLIMKKEG